MILKKRAPIQFAHPLHLQFDDHITLLGYTLKSRQPARRGETLQIVLVWRASQAVHNRYIVSVRLVDGDSRIWSQRDREPGNGWFRTDRWLAADVIPDLYDLELSPNMPSGAYRITAGLYAVNNQERLNTPNPARSLLGSEPILLTIRVDK